MHYPVLLRESLEYLAIRPDGLYLDCTAGLGGHTGAIARAGGKVISCDRDAESLELARANTADVADRIEFRHLSFEQLGGIGPVDGLIADLGVSRLQLTSAERGFSFMASGPVDMRMDRSQEGTAGDIVNYWAEKDLADLLFQLAEERRSRRIAKAIVRARPIRSTAHLAEVIEQAVPRTGPIHPATQSFMALRIATNREMEQLDGLLELIPKLVKPGGRAVILTFMSTEDRKVKQSFQELAREHRAVVLTKHVIRPSEQEVRENPPSRSAKLRAIELL